MKEDRGPSFDLYDRSLTVWAWGILTIANQNFIHRESPFVSIEGLFHKMLRLFQGWEPGHPGRPDRVWIFLVQSVFELTGWDAALPEIEYRECKHSQSQPFYFDPTK